MTTYTPKRTQYPFSANTRYKSRSDVLIMQNQWETFERVENYDDVIFQRIQDGLRDLTYYQFLSNQEFKDYKRGQELHIETFPDLPVSTFASIRDRPLPTTPAKTPLPYFHQVDKFIVAKIPMSADELAQQRSDTEIYAYVSTFNNTHVYKYAFVSDEEKMAYYRAEKRVRSTL
jgi:hypothetical protein